MRACLLAALLFTGVALLPSLAFPQSATDVSQSVVPLEVYVGDVAEVRYSFRMESGAFPDGDFDEEVDVERLPLEEMSAALTVRSSRFSRRDGVLTLALEIVPWRTGEIRFPPFDLRPALGFLKAGSDEEVSLKVELLPVEVMSLVEKTGRSEMQGQLPPFVVPGTSYVVFAFAVAAAVALAFIFRAILKFHDLGAWILRMRLRRTRRRNSVLTLRKLRRLLRDDGASDIEFCAALQSAARSYLSCRFDFPFGARPALGIAAAFREIFLGDVPDFAFPALDDLTAMFVRTDYIRYAHGSLDEGLEPKSEHEACLAPGERKRLVAFAANAVRVFEGDMGGEGEAR